jgi:hypothetical protein
VAAREERDPAPVGCVDQQCGREVLVTHERDQVGVHVSRDIGQRRPGGCGLAERADHARGLLDGGEPLAAHVADDGSSRARGGVCDGVVVGGVAEPLGQRVRVRHVGLHLAQRLVLLDDDEKLGHSTRGCMAPGLGRCRAPCAHRGRAGTGTFDM